MQSRHILLMKTSTGGVKGYCSLEKASDANIDDVKKENPLTGEDLDVPGAELDDANEEIGAEDEENNYYSLGGDNHHNLEDNHE